MSAPSSSGCCHMGERKVLSATASAPAACAASGDRADIHHAQQRIARRFDPHQMRPLLQRRRERRRIALIDEFDREIALRAQRREQPVRAAVAIVGRDDSRAVRQGREHQGDGRQSGACHHRAGAALEIRQRACQLIPRRIAGTGVIVLARLAELLECEIRRQVDRRHDGAVLRRPIRAPREPIASLYFSLEGLCCSCPLLREGRFDDGGQGGAFLQEGVVPEDGIDFDELARTVEARRQAPACRRTAPVGPRAPRSTSLGFARASRPSDADRSIRSGRGTIRRDTSAHSRRRARTDSPRSENGTDLRRARALPPKRSSKFHGAAVGGHGQRTRKLQSRGAVAARDGLAHDLPLHAAPGGRQHLGLVGGAQHHDVLDPARRNAPRSKARPFRRTRRPRWRAAAAIPGAGPRAHRTSAWS